MKLQPTIITNDALVVLCLANLGDQMTHYEFRQRAGIRGFDLSRSQCHNMLHRAMGRVGYYGSNGNNMWKLTAQGWAYREEVISTMSRLLRFDALTP